MRWTRLHRRTGSIYRGHRCDGICSQVAIQYSLPHAAHQGAGCQSTTYGKWIAGDLHIDHCWDNIRLPVLFKTNINKTVTDQGIGGIVFFEIAPRPYLKRGVEQCDGKCISLFRRPNPNERTSTSTNSTHFLTSSPKLSPRYGNQSKVLAATLQLPSQSDSSWATCKMPEMTPQ